MNNKKEWINEEEKVCEEIQKDLDRLDKKWFKTSTTYNLIDFLKEYLQMKQKFIDELKDVKNE